jgi:hypothetical protein
MDRSVVFIGTFRIPDYAAWREAIEEMSRFVSARVQRLRASGVPVSVKSMVTGFLRGTSPAEPTR